jgi:hemoglobin
VYSIAAVVDGFVDRIMEDPKLNSNPLVDEAHHRVSRAGFKYLVTEMVCWATRGPAAVYGPLHERLSRAPADHEPEWTVFLADFQPTLDTFKVPAPEQREVFAIVESTRKDIVIG